MYRVVVVVIASGLSSYLWAVDTVEFSYAWAPGTYAKVAANVTSEKIHSGTSQGTMIIDTSYVMSTKTHEIGLQVEFLNAEVTINSEGRELPAFMQAYMERLSEAIPSYLIDASGDLIGVTDLSAFRENLVYGMEAALEDAPPEVKDQLIGGLGAVFTEEVLNAQIADNWNMTVAQWVGAELDNDGVYELEFETPVPALDNQLVSTYAQFEFVERVNCDDLDRNESCVLLHYRSQTDDVDTRRIMETLVGDIAEVPDYVVSVTNELELVTDPENLLPYYYRLETRSSAPVQTENGVSTFEQIDVQEYDYLYVKGARNH